MSPPLFKDIVDMDHLYKVVNSINRGGVNISKLRQEGSVSDLKQQLSIQAQEKVRILTNILNVMDRAENKENLLNSCTQIHTWVKDNIKKLKHGSDQQLIDIMMHMSGICNRIKNHIDGGIHKAGVAGRSGRKPGYSFQSTEHPRGQGGRFGSKGGAHDLKKPLMQHQGFRTEGGKNLPSYDIVGGKRVGRGIKVVPSEPSMAAARMLGHTMQGAYARATTDPFKAGLVASSKVAEQQNRDIVARESAVKELQNPDITNVERKQILSMIEGIDARRAGARNISGQLKEQFRAGGKALVHQIPYSLMVGATEGVLRGAMERWRSNPFLAPLDIRVRPDILESGLRTAALAVKRTNTEHIGAMMDRAGKEGRTLSVEEYGQIAHLLHMPSDKKREVSRMATTLNDIRNDPNSTPEQHKSAQHMERQLNQNIEDHIVSSIAQPQHHMPYAVRRNIERATKRPNLPIYQLKPEQKQRAEDLLLQIQAKKGKK